MKKVNNTILNNVRSIEGFIEVLEHVQVQAQQELDQDREDHEFPSGLPVQAMLRRHQVEDRLQEV
jgi:hypothetical protein